MRARSALLRAMGVVGLLLFAAQAPVQAAEPTPEQLEKIRQTNDACFACHSADGLKAPPKPGLDLGKLRGLLQHREAFGQSDHGRLACTKCHTEGYDEHPHADDARDMTSTCTDCHAKKAKVIEPQFERSVHAKNLADTFTCVSCHDPHLMRLAERQNDAARIVAQDNRVCLGCHDSDERFARFAPDKKLRPLLEDAHHHLPNPRLHWRSVRCVDCHTPEVGPGEMISHEVVGRDGAERDCVTCHSANSTLKTRLYRHLVKAEQERLGFANSVLLANAYIPGATRHPLLDSAVLGAFAAMLLGLLAHGLGRFLTRRRRPSASDTASTHPAEPPAASAQLEREYLIAPWIRIWHWTNAALIVTLGVTGLSIHFADPNLPLVDFALAVRVHNTAGVLLIAAYLFFVIANIVTGNWWQFVPKPPGILSRLVRQARWYAIGIFRGEPHPHEPSREEHFNVLQAVTYWSVMYLLLPVILLTGLIYLYPQLAPDTLFGFDGLLPIALGHYLAAVALLLFLLSHIYLGTTGKTVGQMFRMMITGWHDR